MRDKKSEALRYADLLEQEAKEHGHLDYKFKASDELRRLHTRVQELEAQLARKVPNKEELADYLMQKDAVIVARKTYEAMRGLTPLRKVDA